jgi:hypothetical protein
MLPQVKSNSEQPEVSGNENEVEPPISTVELEVVGSTIGVPLSGGAVLVKAIRTAAPARSPAWCKSNVSTYCQIPANETEGKQPFDCYNWQPWSSPDENTVHKFSLVEQDFALRIISAGN